MKRRWRGSRTVACVLVAVIFHASCGWRVTPAPAPTQPNAALVAERVVLTVNDGAVAWGGGELGKVVAARLVGLGAFREVFYPIEPRNPPSLRLRITASGKVDEDKAGGVLKAVIIGLFVFLPVGIIRFTKDLTLDATVTFVDGERELRKFPVTSTTEISHTMFSDIAPYEQAAREAAFSNLAERIAAELRAPARPATEPTKSAPGGLP